MRRLALFVFCRYPLCVALLVFPAPNDVAHGLEPARQSPELEHLLQFVPEKTVSLFCVDTPFLLRRYEDLTKVSVFDLAICFTTMISQRDVHSGIAGKEVRCAISAVRRIREPAASAVRPTVDGPFQSQRCELIQLTERLPANWHGGSESGGDSRIREIAGHTVVEVASGNDTILIARIGPSALCLANHMDVLSDVLALVNSGNRNPSGSIVGNGAFRAAKESLSRAPSFWGVRLFTPDDDDPTSVRGASSYAGFHDPNAVFVALELADMKATHVAFYYASEDARAATRFFIEYSRKAVKHWHSRAPFTVPSGSSTPAHVVSSTIADLASGGVPGMSEPGVLFLVLCTVFGQGLLL